MNDAGKKISVINSFSENKLLKTTIDEMLKKADKVFSKYNKKYLNKA